MGEVDVAYVGEDPVAGTCFDAAVADVVKWSWSEHDSIVNGEREANVFVTGTESLGEVANDRGKSAVWSSRGVNGVLDGVEKRLPCVVVEL